MNTLNIHIFERTIIAESNEKIELRGHKLYANNKEIAGFRTEGDEVVIFPFHNAFTQRGTSIASPPDERHFIHIGEKLFVTKRQGPKGWVYDINLVPE